MRGHWSRNLTGLHRTSHIILRCQACGQTYGKGLEPMPREVRPGKYAPCEAPRALSGLPCGSVSYEVWCDIEVEAMPIGRAFNDLSRRW